MNPFNSMGSNSVYAGPPTLPVGDHSWTPHSISPLMSLNGVTTLQSTTPQATLQTWGSQGLGFVNGTGQTFANAAAAAASS